MKGKAGVEKSQFGGWLPDSRDLSGFNFVKKEQFLGRFLKFET